MPFEREEEGEEEGEEGGEGGKGLCPNRCRRRAYSKARGRVHVKEGRYATWPPRIGARDTPVLYALITARQCACRTIATPGNKTLSQYSPHSTHPCKLPLVAKSRAATSPAPTAMLIHLVLFALSSAFALPQQRSAQCPNRFPDIDPPPVRLTNADQASDNLLQSIAAVFSGDDYVCTGALISSLWVLTSSRCDISTMPRVVIGVRDLADAAPEDFLTVAQSFPGEVPVTGGGKASVLLLRLGNGTAAGKPLSVNVAAAVPRVNTYVRVVGFGSTREDDTASAGGKSGIMRQADIPVLENDKCELEPAPDFGVALCAGYKKKNSCGPW